MARRRRRWRQARSRAAGAAPGTAAGSAARRAPPEEWALFGRAGWPARFWGGLSWWTLLRGEVLRQLSVLVAAAWQAVGAKAAVRPRPGVAGPDRDAVWRGNHGTALLGVGVPV